MSPSCAMNWLRIIRTCLPARIVFVNLLGLMVTGAIAAESAPNVQPEGRTELSATLPNHKTARVALVQAIVGNNFPYKEALMWGGDVGKIPKSVVTLIEIHVGKESVFIPLSAYADLGDVRLASINSTARGFELQLHGGDTATSYDASLKFSDSYILSKTVTLREFPRQRLERTLYRFP